MKNNVAGRACRKLNVTFFRNYKATTLATKVLTIEDLRELILTKTADTKEKLPWLKLATFGDQKSPVGSLRHDANVVSIEGLEADYDDEQISFDEAVATVQTAQLKALIYTSPSHTPAKPRWRILSPTSRPLLPEERTKMLARLNGVFGGVFSGESFTLSQAYYFGSVNGNPAHRCEYFGGDYIDLRDDLDAGALGKSENKAPSKATGFEGFLAQLGDGPELDGFHKPLRNAVAAYVAKHSADFDRDALKKRLHEAIDRAPKDKERDYLNDDRHIDALIESAAKKYGEGDEDIQRLNQTHAVLPIGGKARIVTFGEEDEFPRREVIIMTMAFEDFAKIQNKYRHEWTDPKTGETQQSLLGDYWIKSPHRRQYDAGMAFMPHTDEQVFDNKLNLWNGFGVKPEEGDCGLFLEFMCEVICSGNQEHFDYLQKREALILQKRQRSEIALGLRTDKEGAGKGFYEKTMGFLLGSHWMQVNKPTHVVGKFNPHLEKLLRLTADEALFVGNHEHRNTLFGLITESKLTIEPKFMNAYNAANYLNITLTSNAKHIFLAGENARRIFIPTVSEDRVTDFDYFAAIQKQLNNGGYQALLWHLLNIDLSGFNVRAVPKTEGLAEQAAYTRNGIEGLVEEVCNVGRVPCEHLSWPGFTLTGENKYEDGFEAWLGRSKDRELRERLSPNTVVRRLGKEWGCIAERRRESGYPGADTTKRTSGLQWPPLAELRQRFVERFGPQEWRHPELIEWEAAERAKEAAQAAQERKEKEQAEEAEKEAKRKAWEETHKIPKSRKKSR